MSRTGKQQSGWGTLNLIGGLLVASAAVRVATYAEPAFANGSAGDVESLPSESQESAETGSLLAALVAREARLDEREAQLEARMQALHVAEVEIEDKMQALVAAEATLSATITLADGAAESDIARLTSVYENMKPKEAAALFSEMPPQFAAGFLGLMRPESAALIMSELAPETAYGFSVVLAGRNASAPTE